MTRTFVDSNVLIAAARETAPDNEQALRLLSDPTRQFTSSVFVQLEVLPKARHFRKKTELNFYAAFFDGVERWAEDFAAITQQALEEGSRLGLSAVDALHLAAAASTKSDEFVTLERPGRQIYKTNLVDVIWVRRLRKSCCIPCSRN